MSGGFTGSVCTNVSTPTCLFCTVQTALNININIYGVSREEKREKKRGKGRKKNREEELMNTLTISSSDLCRIRIEASFVSWESTKSRGGNFGIGIGSACFLHLL